MAPFRVEARWPGVGASVSPSGGAPWRRVCARPSEAVAEGGDTGLPTVRRGWRDPDSNRSGRRARSWAWMPWRRADGETRTRTGPDDVPGHGHGCRRRGRMARPGLEPVRTTSPVMGLDALTAGGWRDPDSNRGHHDFQSCALPTELSRRGARG